MIDSVLLYYFSVPEFSSKILRISIISLIKFFSFASPMMKFNIGFSSNVEEN